MHSALVRTRSIAFSPDDDAARGGGAAVVDSADEVLQHEDEGGADDTDKDDKQKKDEPVDDRPEWRKRLDAIAKKGEPDTDAAPAGKGGKTDDDADETKPLLVKVPGRKDGEEDIEIPIDRARMKELGLTAKDVRERMGQLRNGYGRKAEIETGRTEIAEGRRQLDEIVTEMRERPTEFFLDNVDAKQYAPLVTALISRMTDADFKTVVQRVAEYDADGSRRRTDGSDSRDKQHTRRQEREREQSVEQKRSEYVKSVTTEINNIIPDDWTDDQAEDLFEFATFKLQQHAAKQRAAGNAKGIAPSEIPALLKSLGVLDHFDLTEPEAGSQPKNRPTSSSSRNAPPPKRSAASGKPRDTATDLEERRTTRRNASTTPGGAGAAAQGGPPKGQTFKDRIAFIRDKFGVKK